MRHVRVYHDFQKSRFAGAEGAFEGWTDLVGVGYALAVAAESVHYLGVVSFLRQVCASSVEGSWG